MHRYLAAGREAVLALSAGPLICSHLYETSAWGKRGQAPFTNQVVGFLPCLEPFELLKQLQAAETRNGRDRCVEERWGPRTLDLDLLSWPGKILNTVDLVLPHPRLSQRRFVLQPWAEVAPKHRPEGMHLCIEELLEKCADQCTVSRLP